jgi:hypothetical protein
VCAPRDDDSCIRAVQPHPQAEKVRNRPTNEQFTGLLLTPAILRKEFLRMVSPDDKAWLTPMFESFYTMYMSTIAPRRRINILDNAENTPTSMMRDMLAVIPVDSDATLRTRIAGGDDEAMVSFESRTLSEYC